jgi:hypothetical protein
VFGKEIHIVLSKHRMVPKMAEDVRCSARIADNRDCIRMRSEEFSLKNFLVFLWKISQVFGMMEISHVLTWKFSIKLGFAERLQET